MRRNLFVLAILCLLCSHRLQAQSQGVEFYHYNSDNIRILESILQYNASPVTKSSVSIIGQSSWEDRLNFNQETRRSLLGSKLGYVGKHFQHILMMDYDSYFDSSDLEPTAYINKNGNLGYRLQWSPAESLHVAVEARGLIRSEQDRYLQDNFRSSDGVQLASNASYRYEKDAFTAGVRANAERKQMNWESYRNIGAQADLSAHSNYMYWESNFSIFKRSDEIYNLVQNSGDSRSSYVKQDEQNRSGLNVYGLIEYYPHPNLGISLAENYNERRTTLSENTIRNNGEFFNNLNLDFKYDLLPGFNIELLSSHMYSIKDFSISQNTRHIENRSLNANSGWEYSPYDSLFAGIGINLQRTSFPANDTWDNDLRNRQLRLGWKHYFRDVIRLSNRFVYSIRDDIYINSLLSANNHNMQSFGFQPESAILLGDRVALLQSYQIRTDYTNYRFHKQRTDKLYRLLSCQFNLIFDSYPYVARSGDARWFSMPYRRNSGYAFLSDFSFSYEENQSGDKEGEVYNINHKTRKYVTGITMKHDIGSFYYSIAPQFSWGTWQEFSLKAGTYWSFDNGSFLELGLTPISEDLKRIDWRSSVNLSIIF